jgi:hypothetical protein
VNETTAHAADVRGTADERVVASVVHMGKGGVDCQPIASMFGLTSDQDGGTSKITKPSLG